ncbi:MAG: TetR/AcrR family transcriptional regulator [Spirochaetales bacterium]|nr:TetR/AcrR family transcriptional regulator [Spirochaetales bacterium]
MSASEIQQERTRGYFLESAKEILRGEGLKAASARNIASRAGYSYPALYTYFKDMNSLIFECVKDFQNEIEESVITMNSGCKTAEEKIKKGISAWVNYFVQYPGIFELFFIEGIGDVGHLKETSNLINNSFGRVCRSGFDQLVEKGRLSGKEADDCLNLLKYQITGIMLYYSNRKFPPDYKSLIELMNNQKSLILQGFGL